MKILSVKTIFLLLPVWGITACQQVPANDVTPPAHSSTDNNEALTAKLESSLAKIIRQMPSGGYPPDAIPEIDGQGQMSLMLMLHSPLTGEQRQTLMDLGLKVDIEAPDHLSIQAHLPADKIMAVAAQPFIRWISPVRHGRLR